MIARPCLALIGAAGQRGGRAPAAASSGFLDADALAYCITEGRVSWESEPVRMHAADAFAAETREQARGGERRGAMHWLRDRLAQGAVPASEAIADGQEYGFSERNLRRALKQLGGRTKKWVWELTA